MAKAILVSVLFMILSRAYAAPESIFADVCVYGGGSGGVTAAIQAARMGKSVVLVSQIPHLGGMTTSGLGFSDIGSVQALGGISREFYHRIYLHYQQGSAWTHQKQGDFKNVGQVAPAFIISNELATVFEPGVAERLFTEMLREAGVRVCIARLDREHGVTKEGTKITGIRAENGQEFQAKMSM